MVSTVCSWSKTLISFLSRHFFVVCALLAIVNNAFRVINSSSAASGRELKGCSNLYCGMMGSYETLCAVCRLITLSLDSFCCRTLSWFLAKALAFYRTSSFVRSCDSTLYPVNKRRIQSQSSSFLLEKVTDILAWVKGCNARIQVAHTKYGCLKQGHTVSMRLLLSHSEWTVL